METFHQLDLPRVLLETLDRINFKTPTEIQKQAIPPALLGKDILGSAQTGTGKTAAFSIPLIVKLMTSPKSAAIIMAPTRELAVQVSKTIETFLGKKSPIRMALLIGGEPMPKQLRQLSTKPRIIVGTPGRINDHLMRRTLSLTNTDFLVLDEMDRMLDMGFSIQIDKIIKLMPYDRQTLMFSATMPKNIMQVAEKYLQNPVNICVGTTSTPVSNIKQEVIHVVENDKYNQLTAQLDKREGSIIVFVKTKHGAERIASRLRGEQHSVETIHGDLRHGKRERVITDFRNRKHRILVATDIAARGLDIPHIEHVINYDLPQCPEDYIHRIGRTARAGAEGEALCFITPSERSKWRAIDRLINPDGDKNIAGSENMPKFERSYDKPRNRSRRNDRFEGSRSDRPRSDRSENSRSDRPRSERSENPRSDRPRGERSENSRSDRPRSERSENSRSDRPRGERFENSRSDRPRSERSENPRSDRPRGERSENSRSDRPRGERSENSRGNDNQAAPSSNFKKRRFNKAS
jgi:ATP-dependent RNA helicase DeaD